MAAPTDTPSNGDIWHLTIDDLLAPLPETVRLGGAGPYVINLSASSAPIELPPRGVAGCRDVHVYQLQRTEDRRVRYRLRLGPFAHEDEADAALKTIRDDYPSALTATADADDLRALAALRVKLPVTQALAEKSEAQLTVSPVPPPSAESIPTLISVPVLTEAQPCPARPVAGPVQNAPLALAAAPALAPAPKVPQPSPAAFALKVPQPPVAAPASKVSQPPVAASSPKLPQPPVAVPASKVSQPLAAASSPKVSQPLAAAATPQVSQPPGAASVPKVPPVSAVAPVLNLSVLPAGAAAPMASPRPAAAAPALPTLESTQTVRALTQLELEDDQASQWYAIQLALAEEAFDPETLPNLDIFTVYRLYSVAGIDQGRIVHALRLGFFTEQIAAGAVASYLAAFYDKPAIKRVSGAERERFAQQSIEPRKDVGATGKQAVIEITNERYIRERRMGQAAAK